MKVVLIVGDGMSDRPLRELGKKTPLEEAHTPNMDEIASKGICGIMDVISPGVPPGSDTAHLALFGYNPYDVYTGRGAFEAIGVGIELLPGDVAFRCNFATVSEDGVVVDRRAGRIDSETAAELAKSLEGVKPPTHPDVEVLVKHATEHRLALVLRGPGLSKMVSDTDPKSPQKPLEECKPLDNSPEAKKTAEVVNELTKLFREVLEHHPINRERAEAGLPPANAVLFRGAGTLPHLEPLSSQYGISFAAIVPTALIRGVAIAAGMKYIPVEGATGTTKTDVMAKARAAVDALKRYDFVFVHVKGTDNASHDGDYQTKMEIIERIDEMVGFISSKISGDDYLALTADHTTGTRARKHLGDPVPVAIYGAEVRVDDVHSYSERSCAKGGLCRIRGVDLMPILMNYVDRGRKFGA